MRLSGQHLLSANLFWREGTSLSGGGGGGGGGDGGIEFP